MSEAVVRLSREVRFGLGDGPIELQAENRFAGSPAQTGVGPFVVVRVQVAGKVDPVTGMVVNIREVDRVVREVAVPLVRRYGSGGGADLVLALREALRGQVRGAEIQQVELAVSPYLRLAAEDKEPTMVQVTQRFEFSAAHRLHSAALSEAANRELFGKCNNPNGHGHNYEVEVTVAGEPDPTTGAVIPILRLQEIVNRRAIDGFDHKHLNLDCVEFARLNPTVENIARVIFERLDGQFGSAVRLRRVRVWETAKTWAEFGG